MSESRTVRAATATATATATVLALALAAVGIIHAVPVEAQSRSDYMLGRPRATLTLRAGAARPNASDGVFAFTSDLLGPRGSQRPLNGNDYVGVSFGGDIGVPLTQRLELQFSASTVSRRVQSEYRNFVDNRDLPIEQATRLRRTPLSLGMRFNLVPAGRSVSRLAWVPTKIIPYVAAGAGAMNYRFRQEGDFVDFRAANLDVFAANLEAKGWAPLAYGATGVTWAMLPAVAINTELRYDHSRAPLQGDFTGFDRTALSGIGLTSGLQFRF